MVPIMESTMEEKTKRNSLFKFLCLVLILFSLIGCSQKAGEEEPNDELKTDLTGELEPIRYLIPEDKREEYRSLWNEKHNINSDYIGQVFFESGLINEPVVFYPNNERYLHLDFYTKEYNLYGTVFEDFNTRYDSQNTVIYGHVVNEIYDPEGVIRFTPLKNLVDQENYEDNKTVYLLLENELREYVIAAVFHVELYEENGLQYPEPNLVYYYADYDKAYFQKYMYEIKNVQFYDTGVECNYEDKFLTLQTCVIRTPEKREIVLCKLINTFYYE